MDDYENVDDKVDDAERVRIVSPRLCAVEELEHAVHADDAIKSEVGVVCPDGNVHQVRRYDAQ